MLCQWLASLNIWPNLLFSFSLGYVFCSFIFYRYHRLMVKKYKSKRGKAVAAKGQAAWEGQSVWQTERMMDVELFLEGQTKWEEDSPHWLVMLYEMFRHSAEKGGKRWSEQSTKATRRASLSWIQKWTYPPFSLLAIKLQKKKSSPSTSRSTSNKGCQGCHLRNRS